MAFILEDGTGIAGANAYIDEAFADTYFTDRGVTEWTGNKQIAIIKATDYIEKRWGRLFKGIKLSATQGLQWPRTTAYDDRGDALTLVPVKLQQATAEYALRALSESLLVDPSTVGQVIRKKEKVDSLEEETEYARSNPTGTATTSGLTISAYPAADMLMEELIRTVQGVIR